MVRMTLPGGGTFKLVFEFTEDYPNKARQVCFLTKLFNPNIYNDGQICLGILQNRWSPIYNIPPFLRRSSPCSAIPTRLPRQTPRHPVFTAKTAASTIVVWEIVEQSWMDES